MVARWLRLSDNRAADSGFADAGNEYDTIMLPIVDTITPMEGMFSVPVSPIPAANVSTVPQRSPLRYPGGKTWFVPHIRSWLSGMETRPDYLVEPFAGGGIVSLTAVMEELARQCVMVEIDRDVAAFWKAALEHNARLISKIQQFTPTRGSIECIAKQTPDDALERGFRALVLNRARRGGILAAGASLPRSGENGKGIGSRWYPETIVRRLQSIANYSERIEFHEADGIALLEKRLASCGQGRTVVFADPPYTDGGKRSGRRLYNHNVVDHHRLFALLSDSDVDFLMTYDASPEILSLVAKHSFFAVRVVMKNTHHDHLSELVITPRPVFCR